MKIINLIAVSRCSACGNPWKLPKRKSKRVAICICGHLMVYGLGSLRELSRADKEHFGNQLRLGNPRAVNIKNLQEKMTRGMWG